MVFVHSMLMLSALIVFNIPFDLMYDICYPLHAETTLFVFTLAIANPTRFD